MTDVVKGGGGVFIWLCITKSKIAYAAKQWKQHRGRDFPPTPYAVYRLRI